MQYVQLTYRQSPPRRSVQLQSQLVLRMLHGSDAACSFLRVHGSVRQHTLLYTHLSSRTDHIGSRVE